MKEITPNDYAYVAASVAERIEGRSFFSGTIRTAHEGFESELITTLVIYRHKPTDTPNGPRQLIGDVYEIVPVWWEFHTYDPEGEEIMNDFSFSDLKPLLISADL